MKRINKKAAWLLRFPDKDESYEKEIEALLQKTNMAGNKNGVSLPFCFDNIVSFLLGNYFVLQINGRNLRKTPCVAGDVFF